MVGYNSWSSSVDPTNFDCNPTNVFGVETTNTASGGDSGGPLLVQYNGAWFGLAVTSASLDAAPNHAVFVYGVPSGWRMCTATSPC